MHYYFEDLDIYIFTTVGMQMQYMDANPEVCLQVEDVHDLEHGRSVTVTGRAEQMTEPHDINRIMQLVNPDPIFEFYPFNHLP